MEKIFQRGLKQNVRFDTVKGKITTEDLYGMPLTHLSSYDLDTVAKSINKELQTSEEESFVRPNTAKNTTLTLKLEIVKFIIADKLADIETRKTASERKARKEYLLSIKSDKIDDKTRKMSMKDIDKELAELNG